MGQLVSVTLKIIICYDLKRKQKIIISCGTDKASQADSQSSITSPSYFLHDGPAPATIRIRSPTLALMKVNFLVENFHNANLIQKPFSIIEKS